MLYRYKLFANVLVGHFTRSIRNKKTIKMASGAFREVISDEHPIYKPEAGRYILYHGYVCPFAQRAMIARAIKKLENIVPVAYVYSVNDPEKGWRFDAATGVDPVYGATHLRQHYLASKPDYEGRITIPVLFDTKTKTIVNNESADIVRIFNTAFNKLLGEKTPNLYPDNLAEEIDKNLMPWLLDDFSFRIYKCGFAKTQEDFDANVAVFFNALDRVEKILSERPFLAGNVLTEADVKVFPWFLRLAPVYENLLKVNLKSLRSDDDYPNIKRWMRKMFQIPGVAATIDMKQVLEGHYLGPLNTLGSKMIPPYRGPDLSKPLAPLSEKDFVWFP